MDLENRINAFVCLGKFLGQFAKADANRIENLPGNEEFYATMPSIMRSAKIHNGWFTEDNLAYTFASWSKVLTKNNLKEWLKDYAVPVKNPKTVAVVMAGNIPMVGFHDFLSILLSGHKAHVKLSSNDNKLLPFLTEYLIAQDPSLKANITFTDGQLKEYDAVIATGSDNTARYFDYYFRKKPNIIRRNRNAIAVLTGKESKEELERLANDIFRYYGLGCRNVSKLYVPKGYDFTPFFQAIYYWKDITQEVKYMNNYDYNKAVYLMSNHKTGDLLDNDFLLLKKEDSFSSPIGVLFYSYYDSIKEVEELLTEQEDKIQCIVSKEDLSMEVIDFGETQNPRLTDYADNVDTMAFLATL
ncbi:MAG TPA: acyl-CoA reductase [Flavobacteriaceae bacterium]|nr:acyl-CoA reductase [Flavobacteriaceae bacterium]